MLPWALHNAPSAAAQERGFSKEEPSPVTVMGQIQQSQWAPNSAAGLPAGFK